ncbi:MAG: hypothetical protein ACK5JD_06335 [Mangrovibacterium sp.]
MTCNKNHKPEGKDRIYTRLHKHQLKAMIEKNPNLKLLIELFDLITPEDLFFRDEKEA